jgi:hypothetical protein
MISGGMASGTVCICDECVSMCIEILHGDGIDLCGERPHMEDPK